MLNSDFVLTGVRHRHAMKNKVSFQQKNVSIFHCHHIVVHVLVVHSLGFCSCQKPIEAIGANAAGATAAMRGSLSSDEVFPRAMTSPKKSKNSELWSDDCCLSALVGFEVVE